QLRADRKATEGKRRVSGEDQRLAIHAPRELWAAPGGRPEKPHTDSIGSPGLEPVESKGEEGRRFRGECLHDERRRPGSGGDMDRPRADHEVAGLDGAAEDANGPIDAGRLRGLSRGVPARSQRRERRRKRRAENPSPFFHGFLLDRCLNGPAGLAGGWTGPRRPGAGPLDSSAPVGRKGCPGARAPSHRPTPSPASCTKTPTHSPPYHYPPR